MQTAYPSNNVFGTTCWAYDPYSVQEPVCMIEDNVDDESSQSDLLSVVNSACDLISVPSTDDEDIPEEIEEEEEVEEIGIKKHPKMRKFSEKHGLLIKIPETCVTLAETRFFRHDPYSTEFSVKLIL